LKFLLKKSLFSIRLLLVISGRNRHKARPRSVIQIGCVLLVSEQNRSASTNKGGETTMANNNNGNHFRDDEIIILEQFRDGK